MSASPSLGVGWGNMCMGSPDNPTYAPPELVFRGWPEAMAAHRLDVIFAQEVMEHHVPLMAKILGTKYFRFTPMHHMECAPGDRNRLGLAVFSHLPFRDLQEVYYGTFNAHPRIAHEREEVGSTDGRLLSCVFQQIAVVAGGVEFILGRSHAPWTYAHDTEFGFIQDAGFHQLLANFGPHGPLSRDQVCGIDTNRPRDAKASAGLPPGWQVFEQVGLTDRVPAWVTSTFDPVYHKGAKAGLEFVLDGLFAGPSYEVPDYELIPGISDHLGYAARIVRAA